MKNAMQFHLDIQGMQVRQLKNMFPGSSMYFTLESYL